GFIAAWLIPHYGWQCLYYVGALMLPISVIFHLLPESPHFLASRSRWDELKALMSKIQPEHASRYASLQPVLAAALPRRPVSSLTLLSREY
ncbi:hypothetical protein SB761_29855, partial [Pseudomonas sp. SIMBA_064]